MQEQGTGGTAVSSDQRTRGDTWTQVYVEPNGRQVFSLAFTQRGTIIAAPFQAGLIRSTDNGNNWSPVVTVLFGTIIRSLTVGNDGNIYAAGSVEIGGLINGVIIRSTDDGQTWTQVVTNPLGTFTSMTTSQTGSIFAAKSYQGILRSTDNGQSWINVGAGIPYFLSVWSLGVTRDGTLLSGTYGNGMYQSTNNGTNWSQVNIGLNHTAVISLSLMPNGDIYAGTAGLEGGLFRSTDNGQRWNQLLLGARIYTVCQLSNGHLFAGAEGTGIHRSTNGGTIWTQTTLQNISVRSLVATDIGHIFAATFSGPTYRSTNAGVSWIPADSPPLNSGLSRLVKSTNGFLFAAKYSGIFRSIDNGSNWQTCFDSSFVYSLAIGPNDRIVVGTDQGVYLSTDYGDSWDHLDSLTNVIISTVCIGNSQEVFASVGTNRVGIFRYSSTTGWTQLNSGLSRTDVYDLLLAPDGHVLAGTGGGGVFRSVESTTSVQLLSDRFPKSHVLHQNYPNPFNPSTTISFDLPSKSFVLLKIFDELGREVAILVKDELSAGTYSREWNASGLASGVYFYRLTAGGFAQTRKLVLLR